MAAEVLDVRAAEVPEIAPRHREVGGAERARLARPEPEIPVQAGGDERRLGRTARQRRIPPAGRHPRVHLAHRADDPRLYQLDRLPHPVARVALISHLRRHAGLLRHPRNEAGLADVVGQRLLAVDVLAGSHRGYDNGRVRVIGGRAEHGVDRGLALEHLPEVHVLRALVVRRDLLVVAFDQLADGLSPGHALEVEPLEVEVLSGIRDGNHLCVGLLEQRTEVRPALASGADEGDVHLVARRDLALPEHVPRDDRERRGGSRGTGTFFQERAAGPGSARIHVTSPCPGIRL